MLDKYAPAGPDVELTRHYCKGGYHPINIGDTFNHRYQVVKKLGFGAHSTVWLVRDHELNRCASLKVLAADTSSRSSELSVSKYLKSLQDKNETHPGREHVVEIFDAFVIRGPNGLHQCIVTEVLGISLASDVREFYELKKGYTPKYRPKDHFESAYLSHFPEDVTRKIAAQVALGVAYLHKCGVVHGDLHLGNVLFYSPILQNASRKETERIYGAAQLTPILLSKDNTPAPPSPHIPRHLIESLPNLPLFEVCLSSVKDIHVKICDFGEAIIINPSAHVEVERPFKTLMPRIFAAPEIMLKDIPSPTTSMDVWALGVLLYMIINHKVPPFRSFGNFRGPIDKEIIEQMVMQLGKLPNKWWEKWSERAEYFDEDGVHLKSYRQNIPRRLCGIYPGLKFSEEERQSFMRVLHKIFRYIPEERISAEEVVPLLPQGWVDPQVLEKFAESGEREKTTCGLGGEDATL